MAICKHNKIKGITVGDIVHCIALYAYDIILLCSSLKQTLLDLVDTFGVFSGYKVNNSKSVIMFLTERERPSSSGSICSVERRVYLSRG